jgi:hypothetical protein
MKRLVSLIKTKFSRNKTVVLFPENEKGVLAECSGNYCSDVC